MSETSAAGRTSIPINGHDVHCKSHYPQLTHVEHCLWCTVIRVVRDEEQAYALSAYNNGYMDGYSDAEAHYDDWVSTNDDIAFDVGERRQ